MRSTSISTACLLALAVLGQSARAEATLPRLVGSGNGFATVDGKPVLLRGCNLGNWLMIEPWMLGWFDVKDQATVFRTLSERFGEDKANALIDSYRQGYVQPRDFEIIKSFGFNVVRLPIDYRLLDDDSAPGQIKKDGFRWVDHAINMAEAAGVYVILDLHGVPGGQSEEGHTGQAGQNRLWGNEANQQRTADLWHALAEHYRGRSVIAAYDLLNEPFGNHHQDLRPDLSALSKRLYDAIRSADPDTTILFPGTLSNGISFYGTPEANGFKNVGFTEHFYPGLYGGKQALSAHARLINQTFPQRAQWLKDANAPYLVGEYNVVLRSNGGDDLMRTYADAFASHGWASTLWSYKVLQPDGGMKPDSWGMVTNAEPMPKIDLNTCSYEEAKAWFDSIGTMKLDVNETLRAALLDPAASKVVLDPLPELPRQAPQDKPPADWKGYDIDASGGGQKVSGNSVTIYGSGSDIFGAADSFRMAAKPLEKQADIAATVSNLLDSDDYAKAGIMIRGSDKPNAAFVMVNLFPNGIISVCWRPSDGAAAQETKFFPDYDGRTASFKLQRDGDNVLASMKINGQWKALKTVQAQLGDHPLAGYAVTSHNNDELTTATFTP